MSNGPERQQAPRLLIVDDDASQLKTLSAVMRARGFEVDPCQTASEAMAHFERDGADVAVVDLRLPDLSGMELLRKLTAADGVPVILHTAYSSFESAKDAVNLGAFAYVEKAGDPNELVHHVHRALEARLRRRAEEAQRLHDEIAANMSEGVYLVRTSDGVIAYANPRFEEMFGYEPGEMVGQHVSCLNAPTDKSPEQTAIEIMDVMAREGSWQGEILNVRKDGTPFWSYASVSMFDYPEHGRVLVSVHTDITDRKRAEEEIENLAKFPSENPDPVLRISADGRVLYANAAGEGLLAAWGSGVGQPVPDVWRDRVSWSLDEGELWREALAHEGRIFSFSGVPVPAAGYVNLYGRDITDRKRAEDELRLLSSRQEAILASVPDIIMEVDEAKVYTWANQAGLEFFGPEVLGKEANCYFEGEQDTYDVVQPLFEGSEETIYYVESWQRRRDGAKRLLAWWCRAIKDPRGHVTGTLSTARDITERKQLEDQLRQAQKMEAIGLLAGGVAHDFRNQLTVIRGYGERLLRRSLVSEEGRQAVEEILKAGERSATLTGQLLAFSRQEMLRPTVVDLNELISDTAKSLSPMIGEDIRLSVTPGRSACRANVDVNQLQQAVLNLVVNARHAMPAGGELVIETSCIEADASFRQRHPGTAPGPYVVLSVTDTGRGMDAETLERVFEPFFTTKEVGQGTGMGLAMVYGFIKQSDGAIEADSEPGKGSTFRLYFPRVEAPAVPIGHIEIPHEIPRGMETILLVEDEEPVRQMLAELLRESGYTVIEASNAAEALPLGEHYEGQIDALVTDIIMPGMSGVQLAQRVRQARPGIAILYITAYGGADLAQRGIVGIDDSDLLVKPFAPADVVRRIRQALASASRPAAR